MNHDHATLTTLKLFHLRMAALYAQRGDTEKAALAREAAYKHESPPPTATGQLAA